MSYYGNPEDYGPDDTGELPGTTTDLFNRLTAERALADEAADLFGECFNDEGTFRFVEDTAVAEVVAWMARWREARGR